MKILGVILSSLVLLLNSIPCCTFDECAEETAVEQNQHQKNTCDSCSPFLSCGACHGFVVQQEIPEVDSFFIVSRKVTFENRATISSNYISIIWQPPRFV